MKKILRYVYLMFFSILLFTGCGLDKEIDYETFYKGDQIVVHGFISLDHGAEAIVKKTVIPNQIENSDFIANPSVWLYEDNKPMIQFVGNGSSKYVTPAGVKLNKLKSYSIYVSCDGFESVQSKPQPLVNKLFIDKVFVSKVDGASRYYLAFEFDDLVGENSFFSYKVHKFYHGIDQYHTSEFIDPLSVKKDADYNTTRLIVETEINNSISSDYKFIGYDSIVFELVSVSEDYYTYSQSAHFYDGTVNSEYDEYVYPIFSNIKNGVGFFASWESTTYTYFPPDSLAR
jgi:hypothetical protein